MIAEDLDHTTVRDRSAGALPEHALELGLQGLQARDAGSIQGSFFKQAVVITGERSRDSHAVQFMLLMVVPFFASKVMAIEQTAVPSQCLWRHGFTELL